MKIYFSYTNNINFGNRPQHLNYFLTTILNEQKINLAERKKMTYNEKKTTTSRRQE